MPGAAEGQDLVAVGVHLGHAQRDFRSLRPGVDEDRLGQVARQPVAVQHVGQLGHDFRDHAAEEMKRLLAGPMDCLDDGRMVVADRGAHLAGGEIQVFPPATVLDDRAAGRGEQPRKDIAAVADQVITGCLFEGSRSSSSPVVRVPAWVRTVPRVHGAIREWQHSASFNQ